MLPSPANKSRRNRIIVASLALFGLATIIAIPGANLFRNNAPLLTAQAATVGCGLSSPAFCETFDAPAGTGNRSGQLNGILWGASRTTGALNGGQGSYGTWYPTTVQSCNGNQAGQPDGTDILICNGQVREATTDGGNVTDIAMYPKQPFDFAGRTGKVTFDVSNDTQGGHAAWPEFWITDQPIPGPFAHEATWISVPRNGFGIRFAGFVNGSGQPNPCPEGSPPYIGADGFIVINNFVTHDNGNTGGVTVQGIDCVKESTGPGQFNHYEIDVSQTMIDVYGTDAGTTSPLKHLTHIPVNLTFSRGLVWIEDAHYNGNKFNSQGTHTFSWDNVGFDGPVLPRDLTFDVPDALTPGAGGINLGYLLQPNSTQAFNVTINNTASAAAALFMFNFSPFSTPVNFTYVVNGNSHTQSWPYPDSVGSSWRTLAVPVPLTDLHDGVNTVSLNAGGTALIVANMDIALVGAGGGGTPPTNTPAPTATSVSTATSVPPTSTSVPPTSTTVATAVPPTATAVPTSTDVPTVVPTDTSTPVSTSTSVPTATTVPTATPTVGNGDGSGCTEHGLWLNGTPQVYTRPISDCADQ
jgi:hypothetical protein